MELRKGADISYPDIKKLVPHSHIITMDAQISQPAQLLNQKKLLNARETNNKLLPIHLNTL